MPRVSDERLKDYCDTAEKKRWIPENTDWEKIALDLRDLREASSKFLIYQMWPARLSNDMTEESWVNMIVPLSELNHLKELLGK